VRPYDPSYSPCATIWSFLLALCDNMILLTHPVRPYDPSYSPCVTIWSFLLTLCENMILLTHPVQKYDPSYSPCVTIRSFWLTLCDNMILLTCSMQKYGSSDFLYAAIWFILLALCWSYLFSAVIWLIWRIRVSAMSTIYSYSAQSMSKNYCSILLNVLNNSSGTNQGRIRPDRSAYSFHSL
jgi:hypothetical protein